MNALLSLAPDERDTAVVQRGKLPLRERFAETGGNISRHGRRHNPLRSIPTADNMIALGLKLSGFSDPQTLTHAYPPFDSQSGKQIRAVERLRDDEQLTCVKSA